VVLSTAIASLNIDVKCFDVLHRMTPLCALQNGLPILGLSRAEARTELDAIGTITGRPSKFMIALRHQVSFALGLFFQR
jgi:hypothetical protein